MSQAKSVKEIREATPEDLAKTLRETSDEILKLRFRKFSGQLENVAQIKELRRKVARIKTVLTERATS